MANEFKTRLMAAAALTGVMAVAHGAQAQSAEPATLDDIAVLSGFGSLATFRHHFRARLSTSPSAYRARFVKTMRAGEACIG